MTETREQSARRAGGIAHDKFFQNGREAMVSFGPKVVEDSIVAFIKLNYRDEVASEEPSAQFYYKLMQAAFIQLFDRGTVQEIHPLTSLGWDFIEQCRRETGVGLQHLSKPAPVVAPVDELREQVRYDWENLSGDAVRKKAANDSEYRRVLNALLDEDNTASATTFSRIESAPDGNRY